jgi:hypothetical protein
VTESEARLADDRRPPRPRGRRSGSDQRVAVPAADAPPTLASGGGDELLRLMERLRDELTSFLNDVAAGRESSRNRDSSRGL